jgi:pimeloyl-ACP methyl ester carboxylesterase/DNA-binding CsgD family transcriptional regulator
MTCPNVLTYREAVGIRSASLPGGGQGRAPCAGGWRPHSDDQVIRFLPHAGRRVAYAVTGRGPALLLDLGRAHHLEAFWRHPPYRRFVRRLSATFTVVRWDRPGFGLSDRHAADLSVDGDVELVGHLIHHLGFDQVAVLAADDAGPVMIQFTARHAALVSRLALIGTAAEGRALAGAALAEALEALASTGTGAGHVHGLLATSVARGCDSGAVTWLTEAMTEAADAATLAELAGQTRRLDARPALGRVRAPTLVLHREDDAVVEAKLARELAAAIPNAGFVALPGVCHLPYEGPIAPAVHALAMFLAGDEAGPGEGELAALSPRELEVARMVTLGLTNAQIGRRLAIQRRTVEAHLEHVRTKLGVRTRARIAVWVVANELGEAAIG